MVNLFGILFWCDKRLEKNDEMFDDSNFMRYYLGIDGGGTKTEFMLVNSEGVEVNRVILAESNPVCVGIEQTFKVLDEGIVTVCEGIPFHKISVFAGIAGGITGNNKQLINEFLKKFSFYSYDNDSDAKNAVETALRGEDGIVVILGTGCISFTSKDGILYRTGGLGYLFDTGGSGYSIGRDAIIAALNCEQEIMPHTILLNLLKKDCGKTTLLESLSDFYEGGNRKIASYAPLVFYAYEQGDVIAKQILNSNFKNVAKLIYDASRYLDIDKIPVYIIGSVTKGKDVIDMIIKGIKELQCEKDFVISVCDTPQVIGALSLAGFKEEIELC